MPGWHEAVKDLVDRGEIAVLGITQEQHADRCRLLAQWKGMGWPIGHDPINLLGSRAVPIVTAVDEWGIVRHTRPTHSWFRDEFLSKRYEKPENVEEQPAATGVPDMARLAGIAERTPSAARWMELADALILWGGTPRIDEAVDAYSSAIELAPDHAAAHFRLGVAYRARYESPSRRDDDFQQAVDSWSRALAIDPNHYIYRRRIQQYGPRLIKPYAFYDWVDQARREITERGETPVKLFVEPGGAEIAGPESRFEVADADDRAPDPEGRIDRDRNGLIRLDATVVPVPIRPGETGRVHLALRPSRGAHWNNEVEPMRIWIEPPSGWIVGSRLHVTPLPGQAESREERRVEFELKAPDAGPFGKDVKLAGYALYYVCEEAGGTCLFLRKDFEISLSRSPSAASRQRPVPTGAVP